ncbi:MAG: DUF2849 domain-containing protein [Pseudomonadota bacterium]
MKLKPTSTAVLTANDMLTGAIVYWTGVGWDTAAELAERAANADAHAALQSVGAAEEAENRVVGAYLVALDPLTGAPLLLRERQRILGPSFPLPGTATLHAEG